MKTKDLTDLKNKNVEQLEKTIANFAKEVADLRMDLRQAKVKNVHLLRQRRKDIAKAMTIKRIKQLSQDQTREVKNVSK